MREDSLFSYDCWSNNDDLQKCVKLKMKMRIIFSKSALFHNPFARSTSIRHRHCEFDSLKVMRQNEMGNPFEEKGEMNVERV